MNLFFKKNYFSEKKYLYLIKGLPRNRHGNLTYDDFVSVGIRNQPARKIPTARFQRCAYKIYLTASTKKTLSKLSSKRLFYEELAKSQSHFSVPLNWKKWLEEK